MICGVTTISALAIGVTTEKHTQKTDSNVDSSLPRYTVVINSKMENTPWLDDENDDNFDENNDDPEKEVLKRKSRNQSEKKRRDQFNVLINELMFLVSGNTRKMDKTTVLQATIAYLRRNKELQAKSQTTEEELNWKPKCLNNQEFGQLMLEALDGFLIAISRQGQILYRVGLQKCKMF